MSLIAETRKLSGKVILRIENGQNDRVGANLSIHLLRMEQRFPVRLIAPIKLLFQSPKKIVITTHHRPDGDAMGAALGLYNYLVQKNQNISVIVPSDYPDFLKWLPQDSMVMNYEKHAAEADKKIAEADILFCLDFNWLSRIEKMEKSARSSKAIKILIDHHLEPEPIFDHSFSYPDACSTCELIYQFMVAMDDRPMVNKAVAECLYTGIMTDTQSFRFETMKADTHRIIAKLMEAGAVNYKIHEHVYDTNSEDRLRLLGVALKDKLVVLSEFNTAYISLTQEELDKYHYQRGDTEGVVNYALSIDGIVMAAFFSPKDKDIKISFRSKNDFSVQELAAKHFEGGGHKHASGGWCSLSLEKTIEKFVGILPEYKDALHAK
jgi:bifunctional oligoribonuclease and PAP phosphatase NrnA